MQNNLLQKLIPILSSVLTDEHRTKYRMASWFGIEKLVIIYRVLAGIRITHNITLTQ